MSSKAAPRKAGAIFAAALTLANMFNVSASASEPFRAFGNFFGPTRTDENGIKIPSCRTGNEQNVQFVSRDPDYFHDKGLFYTDHKMGPGIGENEGPIVYYNSNLLKLMPAYSQTFILYQACLLDYYSDQALRHKLNKTDYTVAEIKADCSAAMILRATKKLSQEQLPLLPFVLDLEFADASIPGFSAKTERRARNIMQCYYYNTPAEDLSPAGKPVRG